MRYTRSLFDAIAARYDVYRAYAPEGSTEAVVVAEEGGEQIGRSDEFTVRMTVQCFSTSIAKAEEMAAFVHALIAEHSPQLGIYTELETEVVHIYEFNFSAPSRL